MNESEVTDRDLLKLMKRDDDAAFSVLYHRYSGLLYVYANKRLGDSESVKDMIQEIFTDLWVRRHKLSVEHLQSYLFQAVRFKVVNQLIKSKRARQHVESLTAFSERFTADADHAVRTHMLQDFIQQQIEELPPKMRYVFELSRKKGMTHHEIAEQLGLSEQSVRSHIKNALRILRRRLGLPMYVFMLLNS